MPPHNLAQRMADDKWKARNLLNLPSISTEGWRLVNSLDRPAVCRTRARSDKRGVDLISDALPFGRLWYEQAPDAIEYAKFYSRSHDAVIRVYDHAGNVIDETHEHAGKFKEP